MAFGDARANFATSTVATAPSPATSGTSLVVAAGEGARFPATSFNAVIAPAAAIPTPTNAEVVRVTARATDTLTITRTQESSSARTVIVGDRIYAGPTAGDMTALEGVVIPDTLLDAKGDLIAASAADTPARVAVGTNTQVLLADSSAASGVAWAAHPRTFPTADLILRSATKLTTGAAAATNYFFQPGVDNAAAASGDIVAADLSVTNDTGLQWGSVIGATAITGFTETWVMVVIIRTGNTAPARTFTITLNPITSAGGTITVGSAVANSTVTSASPAANLFHGPLSSPFTPPASTMHAPIVTVSGAPSGAVVLQASIFRNYAAS